MMSIYKWLPVGLGQGRFGTTRFKLKKTYPLRDEARRVGRGGKKLGLWTHYWVIKGGDSFGLYVRGECHHSPEMIR